MNILLVEDDLALSKAVRKILEQEGWYVDAVYDGPSAIDYAEGADYKLIILDVMLPGLDGFGVLKTLRRDGVNTPILMLTARSTVPDKVAGLRSGADDYMTKPFDTEELLARVEALTRRRDGEVILDELGFEDIALDLRSAMLRCKGGSVQLSRKEFDVLKVFLYNKTATVTKDVLISNAWGADSDAADNSVEVYISFLRKKLRFLGSKVTITNVPKIGYKITTSGEK
ncbi:MAG: response regulator transcription factor [Lachnospiraceae bacterium]|nr:response regulator transcription factor [Lachnospiraceae bacterium]